MKKLALIFSLLLIPGISFADDTYESATTASDDALRERDINGEYQVYSNQSDIKKITTLKSQSGYDSTIHSVYGYAKGKFGVFCIDNTTGLESTDSLKCIDCTSGMRRGVCLQNNDGFGVCVQCSVGQVYDRDNCKCVSAIAHSMSDLLWGKGGKSKSGVDGVCWSLENDEDYKTCVGEGVLVYEEEKTAKNYGKSSGDEDDGNSNGAKNDGKSDGGKDSGDSNGDKNDGKSNGVNKITLSFSTGGHGTAPSDIQCDYGSTLTMPSAITANGYTFVEWSVNGKKFSAGKKSVPCDSANLGVSKGNVTVTAVWNPVKYNINYVLNGGTNYSDAPTTYTVNTSTIVFGTPKHDHGTFEGWYKESSFSHKVAQINKGSTGDITLYAKWRCTGFMYTGDNCASIVGKKKPIKELIINEDNTIGNVSINGSPLYASGNSECVQPYILYKSAVKPSASEYRTLEYDADDSNCNKQYYIVKNSIYKYLYGSCDSCKNGASVRLAGMLLLKSGKDACNFQYYSCPTDNGNKNTNNNNNNSNNNNNNNNKNNNNNSNNNNNNNNGPKVATYPTCADSYIKSRSTTKPSSGYTTSPSDYTNNNNCNKSYLIVNVYGATGVNFLIGNCSSCKDGSSLIQNGGFQVANGCTLPYYSCSTGSTVVGGSTNTNSNSNGNSFNFGGSKINVKIKSGGATNNTEVEEYIKSISLPDLRSYTMGESNGRSATTRRK